jgi:hypothetical protein
VKSCPNSECESVVEYVQILVPRAKVDEARTLLEAHFHPSREVDVDAVFS